MPFLDVHRSLSARLVAGYVLIMLLLALTWAAGAYSAGQINSRITYTVQVDDALLHNLTDRIKVMDDEETGLRGYLLTGQPQFIDPYLHAQRQLPRLRTQGIRLSGRLPAVRPGLAVMLRRVRDWELWAHAILRHPGSNPRSATAIARQKDGKRRFDRFRAASSAVIGTIESDRQHNLHESQRIDEEMNWLSAGISLSALLVTIVVGWLTIRAVTGPLARLRSAADTIGSGDLSQVVQREGTQEFAGLARSMDQMRRHLVKEAANRREAEEALQRHANRLSAIVETQAAVAAAVPDLNRVLQLVTERAQGLTGAGGAVIELVDGDEMVYHTATGSAASSVGLRLSRDTSLSGLCMRTGEILCYDDADTDPRVDRAACRPVGARSMIVVPLRTEAHIAGALKVLSPEAHTFDEHDVDTLQLMAGEITAAMRTASEFEAKQALLVDRTRIGDALARTNAELESFAYSVSHDLRAPLRSMEGFSQVLLDRYADRLDDRGVRYLNHVCDAAKEMGQLIDAMLTLSRVSRGDMQREPVDLSALAHSIVSGFRANDPGREVVTDIAPGIIACGDERLLRALLQNLLGNAWKFTRTCLDARIEFGVTERDGVATCYVRDNGVGFDMEYATKLFAPFQRLHRVRDFEGTGIGLATVQRIVQRHSGRVRAEGAVGQGATFYFTLELLREGSLCLPVTA